MAVKFGVAFGNEVTVISTSESKKEQAIKLLGAKHFVNSRDNEQMKSAGSTLDFIVDCVSAPKDMNSYVNLLKTGGSLVSVALPPLGYSFDLNPFLMVMKSIGVYGSLVGGLKGTQEMLDFCGNSGITSMVEVIKMNEINHAFERMLKSDVRYRFVIDIVNSEF